jgi:hypothetical protein
LEIVGKRDGHGASYARHIALLLLGELGPQAKTAVAVIRHVAAEEQDARLTRVARFTLTKIER